MLGDAAREAVKPADSARRLEEVCRRIGARSEGRGDTTETGNAGDEGIGRRWVTLWFVLKRYAEAFYQTGSLLGIMQAQADVRPPELTNVKVLGAVNVTIWQRLKEVIPEALSERISQLDLPLSSKTVHRLAILLNDPLAEHDKIAACVQELDRRIRDELTDRVLFYVPPERAALYDEFRKGWEAALMKFPIAADVEEAQKCYVFERWTGCVFHLMRVAELGVNALGKHLGVSNATLERPWGDVVKEAGDKVRVMPHRTSADKAKQSEAAALVDYLFQVNLAWRIPSMHPARTPGDKYTEEEATDAIARLKSFMRALADAIA